MPLKSSIDMEDASLDMEYDVEMTVDDSIDMGDDHIDMGYLATLEQSRRRKVTDRPALPRRRPPAAAAAAAPPPHRSSAS